MKLWNLLGISLFKSYCLKVIKNKPAYSKADFDEIVRKALLKDFAKQNSDSDHLISVK